MKRKLRYKIKDKAVEREINYIPVRYIIAVLITVFEITAIIGIVFALCYFVPYFYIAAWLTEIFCVVRIVSSDDNPDYKVPWLLFVLILPVAGFMLYFIFSSRKLKKKYVKRLESLKDISYPSEDKLLTDRLVKEDKIAASHAKMLCDISESHIFTNTRQTYFPLGEDMHKSMLADLRCAKHFIYMEYFIIEEGIFWNSILDILKEKAKRGVEVRVVYDDIGCMSTLPGNYSKILGTLGISATPFSRLRGNADSEFNNRSHRKICVIDGRVGYTGGVNIADEYINETVRFGHWKDTAVRLEGDAVRELTKTFLVDYGINVKEVPVLRSDLFPECDIEDQGYMVPFGDGPRPIYKNRVGKSVIRNMLSAATDYVYITTPYLIVDNELCTSIEDTAKRGVDVRIIVPHIPDKKAVFAITRSFYSRLMAAGVRIYEYEPGFIHAKSCVADGKYAMIGTINLDYRSLVHHFENGVWMYGCRAIADIKLDIDKTLEKCIEMTPADLKTSIFARIFRSLARVFAPLM